MTAPTPLTDPHADGPPGPRSTPRAPRVVIDNGAYHMDNLGDVAMLRVTVARVLERWPGAELHVLTQRPERVERAFEGDARVVPLRASAWHFLPMTRGPKWLRYNPVANRLRWRARLWQRRRPRLAHALKRAAWGGGGGRDSLWADAERFFDVLGRADAVIATGGGYINDYFHEHADKVLATLGVAQGLGLPTAMLGAGLGPITRPDLAMLAAPVLRGLDVLAVREGEAAGRELLMLGNLAHRHRHRRGGDPIRELAIPCVVTGDDAIEAAAAHAPTELGRDIGVNLRLSGHSEVGADAPGRVAAALRGVAARHGGEHGGEGGEGGAMLRTVPIRCHLSPRNDVDAARATFGDAADHDAASRADLPEHLYPIVSSCRVMVTGSYHAAVFALSMGVPVVGLSSSDYYDAKLGGLARQFGGGGEGEGEGGMVVLDLRAADLEQRLGEACDRLWHAAPSLRDPLRTAAARQVAQSAAAYRGFFDLVDTRLEA